MLSLHCIFLGRLPLGQDIVGEAQNNRMGRSVSLAADGLTVAVGVHGTSVNGLESGSIRVYQYNSVTRLWGQLGQAMNGDGEGDG